MPNFHGLEPDPCDGCKTTDNLRFFRWTRGQRINRSYPTMAGEVSRLEITEPEVLLECTRDNLLKRVPVSWDWTPPQEWSRNRG